MKPFSCAGSIYFRVTIDFLETSGKLRIHLLSFLYHIIIYQITFYEFIRDIIPG